MATDSSLQARSKPLILGGSRPASEQPDGFLAPRAARTRPTTGLSWPIGLFRVARRLPETLRIPVAATRHRAPQSGAGSAFRRARKRVFGRGASDARQSG